MEANAESNSTTGSDDLLQLDMGGGAQNTQQSSESAILGSMANTTGTKSIQRDDGQSDELVSDACVCPKSILYEDANIQVGINQQYKGAMGRIMLYFGQ